MTEPVVRAGGGIIWRRGQGGGVELVLAHRPGETEAQGAARGPGGDRALVRLGREVGTTSYRDPKRRPKTVRYWEMTPTAGTLGPANEIDDVRWVQLGEALRLLTDDHDRRLLDGWQPAG